MAKTFDDLMAIAKKVYADSRHQDRDHAELTIVEALGRVYSDGCQETLDEVQARLAVPVKA
jgi:hypothetical protein